MTRLALPLIALILVSTNAFANVYETGKITRMVAEGESFVSVWLDGSDDISECTGGERWTLETSDPLHKEKYAALLSAAAAGKVIKLIHLSGSDCGQWASNKIYLISIEY